MNITPEQLKEEKQYLEKTLSVIKEMLNNGDTNIQKKMQEINEMKKYIWENNATLDDIEIASGMYNVNCDVSYTNENIKKLLKLKKSLGNPYFGRVDFESDGFSEPIYIGINGIAKDMNFYIFDWRTPIASLFYNYGTGPASYEAPSGTISGNISLKRQYKISNEKIERCFNSDLNIDDEYLQEILANASSEKMTNIVNTIQKEQNEIIRNVSDKYLIVQGIAGSGKTSVALHRIAYLLYKEKDLNSNNVLIFSPNDVFSQYISNVLPELGEDNVLQTTFSDFAHTYMKDYKQIESFTEFVDRYYNNANLTKEEKKIIQFKLSDDFKKLIDNHIYKCKNDISFLKSIKINEKVVDLDLLNKLLKNGYVNLPISERIERIVEYICDYTNISYRKNNNIIREKVKSILNRDLDVKELYTSIVSSQDFKEKAKLKESVSYTNDKKLNYEDLLPLMYVYFEMNGYPKNNNIKHIIIDEAQDYTLLQFYILKKIFYASSFTILGDVYQTINPYYIYKNLQNINSIFDNKGKYIELNKTYRSSQEIITFTNKILGLNNSCSVRKSNEIPVIIKKVLQDQIAYQITQDIDLMKEHGMKRIAIITKNNSEAIELYNILKNHLSNLHLLNQQQEDAMSNLLLLPSYISKGLEFDGVIIYVKEDNKYQAKDKYLFYVVCTRAQHSLIVYNQPTIKLERKKNGK